MGGYGQRKEKGKCCNQRKKVENTSTFVLVFVIYVTGLGNRTGITGIAGNNTIIQLGGEYFPPLLGYAQWHRRLPSAPTSTTLYSCGFMPFYEGASALMMSHTKGR